MSVAAGLNSVQSNRKRNSEKANNEYRTRNNEYRSKVFYHYYFLKRLSAAIPYFIISASGGFDILRFAVKILRSFIRAVW